MRAVSIFSSNSWRWKQKSENALVGAIKLKPKAEVWLVRSSPVIFPLDEADFVLTFDNLLRDWSVSHLPCRNSPLSSPLQVTEAAEEATEEKA